MLPYHRHLLISQGRCPRLYGVWLALRNRCNNPRNKDYPRYGGRGIKVCKRWDNFDVFALDVGPVPGGLGWSLDRKNNNQNYRRGNTRWARPPLQGQNRRSTKLSYRWVRWIIANEGKITQRAMAKLAGVSQPQISKVMRRRQWK